MLFKQGRNAFRTTSCKRFGDNFKCGQVKTQGSGPRLDISLILLYFLLTANAATLIFISGLLRLLRKGNQVLFIIG